MHRVLCIIPARAGSKRLPGKNKALLSNKPLVLYSIEAAIQSECFSKIILSTNDSDIIKLGKTIPEIDVWERDEKLSGDNFRAKDVAYSHLLECNKGDYNYICLMMPTTPFRSSVNIREAFKKISDRRGKTLASVSPFEFQPSMALKINNHCLESYFFDKFEWKKEQDFDEAFRPNGAIFISETYHFLEKKTFLENGTIPYIMDHIHSLDIDTLEDLEYAQYLMDNKKI